MICIKGLLIVLFVGLVAPIADCYAHAVGKFLAIKRAENEADEGGVILNRRLVIIG